MPKRPEASDFFLHLLSRQFRHQDTHLMFGNAGALFHGKRANSEDESTLSRHLFLCSLRTSENTLGRWVKKTTTSHRFLLLGNHGEDERVPKLPSGPGTIQSRSLSASQQGSQSTPVPSLSLRRQDFRATSSWSHLLHRSSILARQKHAGGGAVSLSVMIETLPQDAS
jgi:hypothetical protein